MCMMALVLSMPVSADDAALESALKNLGFKFEDGKLVVDDKVRQTTELDLTGRSITDFTGIGAFENLSSLLLDGSTYPVVGTDFFNNIKASNAGITSVSMRNCGIESIDLGSASAFRRLYLDGNNKFQTIANFGASTPAFEYISLPESAKWNYTEILSYFTAHKDAAMEIEIDGSLQRYTNLRKVPNEKFRAFLMGKYPELFDADQMLDLTKEPQFDEDPNLNDMDWYTSSYNFMYFDASGMGDMDGYQFFKNRAIRRWWIYNAEFESIDMSGDKVIQEFVIGQNQATDDFMSERGPNTKVRSINMEGCENLNMLQTDGAVENVNMKGCSNLIYFVCGPSITRADISGCSRMEVFYNSTALDRKAGVSALGEIIMPASYVGNGFKQFDVSNSSIAEFDFTQIVPSEDDGVLIAAERCPNLKYARYNNKLQIQSSFNYGYFEEIDLRGALMKNPKGEWVSAEDNEDFYGKKNPYLKIVNGKEYITQDDPDFVKSFEADLSKWDHWTYFQFNEYTGYLEIVEEVRYDEDEAWKDIADWDFAMHAYNLRTNSGASGSYGAGIHANDDVKWEFIKDALDKLTYTEDEMGENNLVVDISNMPPKMVSAPMSSVEVFEDFGRGIVKPFNKTFVLRLASNRGYAVVKFAKYNDGQVKIKYNLILNDNLGIEDVEAGSSDPAEIYTIDGMRSDKLVKGMNIVKYSGGKVKKIIKK